MVRLAVLIATATITAAAFLGHEVTVAIQHTMTQAGVS